MRNPLRRSKTSPEAIRLAVMMYVRFPLSLRQVDDLIYERGIDICHETERAWRNRFGPMFAAEIRNRRSASMRAPIQWRWHLGRWHLGRWHLDEVFVRINGETGSVRLNLQDVKTPMTGILSPSVHTTRPGRLAPRTRR